MMDPHLLMTVGKVTIISLTVLGIGLLAAVFGLVLAALLERFE